MLDSAHPYIRACISIVMALLRIDIIALAHPFTIQATNKLASLQAAWLGLYDASVIPGSWLWWGDRLLLWECETYVFQGWAEAWRACLLLGSRHGNVEPSMR